MTADLNALALEAQEWVDAYLSSQVSETIQRAGAKPIRDLIAAVSALTTAALPVGGGVAGSGPGGSYALTAATPPSEEKWGRIFDESLRRYRWVWNGPPGTEPKDDPLRVTTPPTATPSAVPEEVRRYTIDLVRNAMLTAWNEICDDTGCHPLDIEQGPGKTLTFTPRHWARMAGEMVTAQISRLLSTPRAEAATGTEEVRSDLPDGDAPPKDWYCQNCSEVVPLKQRCTICGKREADKS